MKYITSYRHLGGKRVLLRLDLNVPIRKEHIEDMNKLRASLPTLRHLARVGARVVIVSHLGRPEGRIDPRLSLEPIGQELSKVLKKRIRYIDTGTYDFSAQGWQEIGGEINSLRPGQIAMLENIRFSPDEEKNTGTLARDLAGLFDLYVNDAFAVSHRAAASTVGLPEYLPSYAGLQLMKELKGLGHVMKNPKPPVITVIGGAKMETKIPVLKSMLKTADHVLVGGGIVNTYLAAMGYGIGSSLVDKDFYEEAKRYVGKKKVEKPLDIVVGSKDGESWSVVDIGKKPHVICAKGEAIYDIGPRTIALYHDVIMSAKTIVWNGAMGYFEVPPYHVATMAMADMIAERGTKRGVYTVVGGGETVLSMDQLGRSDDIDLVSTGGGAMLEYLAGETLPGIQALDA